MTYKPFDTIRKQTDLEQTVKSVRKIWYQFAEGILSFTGSYNQYKSLHQQLTAYFSTGWDLCIEHDGSVHAKYSLPKENLLLSVFKQKDGKESIELLPLIE